MGLIAVGGMQHETNTFAPSKADYRAFEQGGGWPTVQYGESLFDAVAGANIPVQGAITALRGANHRVVPLTWAAASPSAHVTDDAFERIAGSICTDLERINHLDGVYLDLHGAMVTESHDDGEGELLRRVRELVGPRIPVVASLDLHANVTQQMVDMTDALTIYRTYPHVDMAETGARAVGLLMRLLSTGKAFAKGFRQIDFLTGIPSQSTFIEPARSLYRLLERLEETSGVALSLAMGFPMADFPDCGMSVIGYGDRRATEAVLDDLADAVAQAERQFAMQLYEPHSAVERALRVGSIGRPAVIADTQDNPGAGGNGDTTGMLDALIRANAQDAVLGLLIDPASARQAHEMGEGASGAFKLGAISGLAGHKAVGGRFTVLKLGDGRFTCTGPMYQGFQMNLGPMALLQTGGVKVVVATLKTQAADQAMFRHVGVEPVRQRVMVLKSSVHYRADFEPIASEVIVARAPGPCLADPAEFPWKNLRVGLRTSPLGQPFGL